MVADIRSSEIWRPIPKWDRYEVSNLGRIRSKQIRCASAHISGRKGRVLKTKCNRRYRTVTLCGLNGERKQFMLHQLVLLVFAGKRPKGFQCCHNDGNPANNKAVNLRYDTPKNNTADKYTHGTMPFHEDAPRAKLTWAKVRLMRRFGYLPQNILVEMFKVSKTTIREVLNNKRWVK